MVWNKMEGIIMEKRTGKTNRTGSLYQYIHIELSMESKLTCSLCLLCLFWYTPQEMRHTPSFPMELLIRTSPQEIKVKNTNANFNIPHKKPDSLITISKFLGNEGWAGCGSVFNYLMILPIIIPAGGLKCI